MPDINSDEMEQAVEGQLSGSTATPLLLTVSSRWGFSTEDMIRSLHHLTQVLGIGAECSMPLGDKDVPNTVDNWNDGPYAGVLYRCIMDPDDPIEKFFAEIENARKEYTAHKLYPETLNVKN